MKYLKLLAAVALLAILAGCATPTPPAPQFRNIFVAPSASLMKDCAISAPPSKEAFMKATDEERTKFLRDYNIKLLGDMKNCNAQWASLRDWMVKQEAIHTKDNPK